MPSIDLQKAQAQLPDLVDQLEGHESVIITHDGAPVAELSPVPPESHDSHDATPADDAARPSTRPKIPGLTSPPAGLVYTDAYDALISRLAQQKLEQLRKQLG